MIQDIEFPFRQLPKIFSVALREGFDLFGSSFIEYAAYRDRSHAFESSDVATQRSFDSGEDDYDSA
jgi:hypothetical protein